MNLEIFVPYWGDPDLLFATVASVKAQNDGEWTLIVLDDRYPGDAAAAYFAEETDPRITYVVNEKNLGITDNYREAIRRASQPYITILGCDDLLHPNYVQVVKETIAQFPHADVIQPGVEVIDEHGATITPLVDRVKQGVLAPRGTASVELSGARMAESLIRGDWLYWPSLTFRTETMRRIDFRDGLPIIQDLALLIDIALERGSLAYNPTLAFSYRRHGSSASQKTLLDGRRFRDERTYYRQARELFRAQGWNRAARIARGRWMSRLHAVAEVPGVLRHGDGAGLKSTLAHIFAV